MLFIGIVLFAVNAKAQTNYYMETGTFRESGFTYQADVERVVDRLLRSTTLRSTDIDMNDKTGKVILSNKNNRYRFLPETFRDGTPVDLRTWESPWEGGSLSIRNNVRTIINSILSASERERMGKHRLEVTVFFNSDTGRAMESHFAFDKDNPFATLHVPVYRKIELEILRQLTITPTAYGRRLSFIGWASNIDLN
jgi:hypothetical protein